MATVSLFFVSTGALKLARIESTYGGSLRCSINRSLVGDDGLTDSFKWTRGVIALSVLLIRSALSSRDSTCDAFLAGDGGTLAAALDRALNREPVWLRAVFGTDSRGAPLSRKIFRRSNRGRRCGGVVTISLVRSLEGNGVRIVLDGKEVSDLNHLRAILGELEQAR